MMSNVAKCFVILGTSILYIRESFDKFSKFPWNGAQSIWWRNISKDPLFEPLQAKFQPKRTHSSHLVVIWSRLSQSLQNTHWQWLPYLTRISSHRAKFLSLGTERSHTGPNPENRVDEESIHSPICILSLQRSTCGTARCLDRKALFCASISLQMTTKRELCLFSGWNLAWRGSKNGSFEMSRHQMDCSAISWKFTKLIKWPTYIYIYNIIKKIIWGFKKFKMHKIDNLSFNFFYC